jgi:hypothetical protein
VSWNGAIPAGSDVTVTISARLNEGTAGEVISNQAMVHYDMNRDGTNESQIATDDPASVAARDATAFVVGPLDAIPALSGAWLLLLALACAAVGVSSRM